MRTTFSIFTVFISLLLIFLCSCSSKSVELPEVTEDFCAKIHKGEDTVSLDGQLSQFADKMKTQTAAYVLEDAGEALAARAFLCEYAQKSIDVQYFIFSTDNVGLIASDYLVRAADRGVKVRVIVDDIMVEAKPEEIHTLDVHENIEIRIYNPGVNVGKNLVQKIGKFDLDFKGANQRMHIKTFIVDGKVFITGGRNVADEYFGYDHEYNFRDRDVLLIGKDTRQAEVSFNYFWENDLTVPLNQLVKVKNKGDAKLIYERLHQYACNPENFWPQVREQIRKVPQALKNIIENEKLVWMDSVQFIADMPGKSVDDGSNRTTPALIALVKNAKKTIDIQSPYLVTTDLGKKIFEDAVKRGVKVRILTNSLASTDNLATFNGYQRDRKKLLKTGVRIFEFRPDAAVSARNMSEVLKQQPEHQPTFGLHAKTMVIDGKITVIGAFNVDPRSAYLNCECVAIMFSEKIAAGVSKGLEEEFGPENSWESTSEWNPDGEASRLKRIKSRGSRVVPKGIL